MPHLFYRLDLQPYTWTHLHRDPGPISSVLLACLGRNIQGLRDAVLQTNETLTPAAYFDILTGCAADFDMWEVKYYHPLADHRALVEWVKGTKLRPYLDFLGAERGRQFEEALVRRAAALYPVRKNGGVVLGFRRFFFTAER